MVTAVAAAQESPSKKLHRLANGAAANGDFEFRHWRPARRSRSGMRRRWAPPEIEIPGGGRRDAQGVYTSLRDIMSSPEYAASAKDHSPRSGGAGGDVHMIRHPLVKHAAYAYLQLTPSAREDAARRRRRRDNPFYRLLDGCLGFVGAFFAR